MSETHLTDVAFSQLPLAEELARGLDEAGFTHCTSIQAETLPLALKGKDIAGQAQTGTGKSAAFLLAMMSRLLATPRDPDADPKQPRALVLAPTRELAIQIAKDGQQLGGHTSLRQVVVYGGAGYDTQREAVAAGTDILIGTPGRLIDYFKQHIYDLKQVEVLVLDEADRMFDLGFIKDIRFLLRRLPPPHKRLNLLFSATLSMRVQELAYEHMNSPETINVAPDKKTADRVTQVLYHVGKDEKMALLIGLMRRMDPHRTLVFANTKRVVERVRDFLALNGFNAEALSGDVPQKKRLRLLEDFQAGKLPVMVATDVAARGLHIPAVSHVFNFDLPQDCEDYVHRIGRTARAGASGDAISFGCEEYVFSLMDIESYIGHAIPTEQVSDELLAEIKTPPRRPRKPRHKGAGKGQHRGRDGRSRGRPGGNRSRGSKAEA